MNLNLIFPINRQVCLLLVSRYAVGGNSYILMWLLSTCQNTSSLCCSPCSALIY
jgi:hypothetical protein